MSPEQAKLLAGSIDFLDSGSAGPDILRFLAWLGITEPEVLEDAEDFRKLLRFAQGLHRFFELPLPDAPGLSAFGAELNIARWAEGESGIFGVSGVAESRLAAFRACIAEAIEFVSQYLDGDAAVHLRISSPEPAVISLTQGYADWSVDGPVATVPSPDGGGATRRFPATLCYRNANLPGPAPLQNLGIGCGSGATSAAALHHALFEWIERDAMALWWLGARQGRPVALETLAQTEMAGIATRARQGQQTRRTWFLDISTDIGVPVMAALSTDGHGNGFAYGFGAGANTAAAMKAAFLELCQIELADRIVAAKRHESGDDKLNDTDRMHLRRHSEIDASWEILHPGGAPRDHVAQADPEAALAAAGLDVLTIDLTRADIGVPVWRTFVPGLQPMPSATELPRLREAQKAAHGRVHNHRAIRIV
ncbi:YcaO-like family protein [Minwuia thermotolerans]|uniref:YcaO domain-containing protein n=1 Tax=Minwuia thermotolerans TaxID=2056226 RepID=A0A2M9G7L9_9PROT|nr:YcaO-like family protein [Minwuia thermotolerans]PJK31693.1 hypothetical protein CVT23_01200 [Minwuia thermotolerans]